MSAEVQPTWEPFNTTEAKDSSGTSKVLHMVRAALMRRSELGCEGPAVQNLAFNRIREKKQRFMASEDQVFLSCLERFAASLGTETKVP
jgi:hypothetical protein